MAESVSIAAVERLGGRLHVRYAGNRGVIFASAADAQAILDAARAAVTPEFLTVLALKKIGPVNAEQLEGKTVTLALDVTIA